MNDLTDIVPIVAQHFGLAPTTLLLAAWIIHKVAYVVAKRIPDDATGWRGTVRDISGIIGVDAQNVLTTTPDGKPVTIADVTAEQAAKAVSTSSTQGA